MADTSPSNRQKRQREGDNEQNPKHRKQDSSNDSHEADELMELSHSIESIESTEEATETEQKKQDSTHSKEATGEEEENIGSQSSNSSNESSVDLDNLSLNELLTLAKLSYRRRKAIETVFARKYGTEWLHVNASVEFKIKKWINIMRFFGHMVTKLHINYTKIDLEDCIELDRCMNEHCADSLVELKIQSAPRYIMNHMTKPFSKIEIITFIDCMLARNSTDFSRWFPMVCRLVFSGYNKLDDQKCIGVYFPHLEELEIETTKRKPTFKKSNVAKALRINPYLRRLKIVSDLLDEEFLRDVSQHL